MSKMENKNPNIDLSIKKEDHPVAVFMVSMKNVQNIVVKLTPKDEKAAKETPLLIAAHIDGHALISGGTAYDDAINCVAMWGSIEALLRTNYQISAPIYFLFDGTEEFGLHGAENFVATHNGTHFNYLNLEAMGSALPFALVIKSPTNSGSTIKAFSKVKGGISATFFNDLYSTGLIQSGSDCSVFDREKYGGAMGVYIGESSHYHTKYDMIKNSLDLEMEGKLMLDFILKFKSLSSGNYASYGIAPLSIAVSNLFIYIAVPITVAISLVLIILFTLSNAKNFVDLVRFSQKKNYSIMQSSLTDASLQNKEDENPDKSYCNNFIVYLLDFLKFLGIFVVLFIIFAAYLIVIYYTNYCSFTLKNKQFFFAASFSFMGLLFMCLGQKIAKN